MPSNATTKTRTNTRPATIRFLPTGSLHWSGYFRTIDETLANLTTTVRERTIVEKAENVTDARIREHRTVFDPKRDAVIAVPADVIHRVRVTEREGFHLRPGSVICHHDGTQARVVLDVVLRNTTRWLRVWDVDTHEISSVPLDVAAMVHTRTVEILSDAVKCDCSGGRWYGAGVIENGVFKGQSGKCFRCDGKGYQDAADRKRNRYYDDHVRRV